MFNRIPKLRPALRLVFQSERDALDEAIVVAFFKRTSLRGQLVR